MEKGERLKDLPIMWLPGKSPMVERDGSFASSTRGLVKEVRDAKTVGVKEGRGRSWFGFWRRDL
jgi:hypothetical protein